MKLSVMMCGLVLAFAAISVGQSENDDPYSINLVKFELDARFGGTRIIHSWSQKGIARLGDLVSVAILKILNEEDLTDSVKIRNFLPLVREAFEHPEFISRESDRKPRITLFLLNHIQQHISDKQVEEDIRQTIEFVKEKSAELPPPSAAP
jgi:hypothetical protein